MSTSNAAWEAAFSRETAVGELIERLIEECTATVDAALYRFNNPRLARALAGATERGARLRLILDAGKRDADGATRDLLTHYRLPFRQIRGRMKTGSKMHHKFAILDRRTVLTGSYNWTMESEEENYENLLVARESLVVETYQSEFEALWREARRDE